MTGPIDVINASVMQEISKEMFYSQYGTCKDVDKSKRTCTFIPAGDEAERINIRLQALMSSNRGFVMIPREGSDIAVTFVNKHTGFVALTEDVEEIIIDTDTITVNGGNNGGLTNTPVLRTELNKTTARTTSAEAALIAFCAAQLTAIAAFPVLAPLAPAYTALSTAIGGLPLQGLYNENIEDENFKH